MIIIMLQPTGTSECRGKGKSSMCATSMGHRLMQLSRALVVKAREAGENHGYSLYMLRRLRGDTDA